MKRLRKVDGLGVGDVVTWECTGCGETQVAFGGAAPPANGLCWGCQQRPRAMARPELLRLAGVPQLYSRYADRQAWVHHFRRAWPAELLEWRGKPEVAYLWGETGTGKTTAAAVLLAEHLERAEPGLWTSGFELREQLRREFSAELPSAAVQRLLRPRLLIFDEPLAGDPKPWYLDAVYAVVEGRSARGLATVYTSQLGPEALIPKTMDGPIPPALASRLLSGLERYFSGEDARLRREGEW